MATYDYGKPRATAQKRFIKYGLPATLRRETQTAGTPWNPGVTEVKNYPVTALLDEFSERLIDGTNIRYGDRKIFIGAETLVTESIIPTTDDKVLLGGVGYKIINVKAVAPANVVVMYELHARGAGV